MKGLIFGLTVVLLAMAILFTGCAKATPAAPAPAPAQNSTQLATASNITEGLPVGTSAPNFQLQSLDGKTVSLNDLRGQPVMVNFWATWCPFCRAERPTIQQVYDEWKTKGVVVLTIDIIDSRPTETAENAANFMSTNNYSFPVLLDNKMLVTRVYNIKQTPTSFLIDKDGVIREVTVGVYTKATLDASLNQLLLK